MDETIYQCAECNFNADNLTELDSHIMEFHSNEIKNGNRHNEMDGDMSYDEDQINYNNINGITNDDYEDEDDNIFIENEISNNSNQQFYSQQKKNHNTFNDNDEYYYEDKNTPNTLPINTKTSASIVKVASQPNENNGITKPHNLRQKQPIDYNGLNGTASTATVSNTCTRRSVHAVTPTKPVNSNIPIINSDNHYERQYNCKRCGFFTNNPRAVLYHRKEFHSEKINIHECTYCQYASQYSGKVERHTLLRHKIDLNNSPSKKTSKLNNKTLENSSLNLTDLGNSNLNDSTSQPNNKQPQTQQMQQASADSESFQCSKCPCKYKRSNDLYKHLKLKHGVVSINSLNQSENQVKHEDESFFNDEEIQDENKKIENSNVNNNSNSNSYECPYCTYYSNGNDAEYLLHVKDHLSGKSFRCVLCNSVYKYRGDCVVHLKRKHQKADMHAQSYVERFNLDNLEISQICVLLKPKQQEEIENEEKLFSCSYCDYRANYKGDVFKHQTRRHPGLAKNVILLNPQLNGSHNNSAMAYNIQNITSASAFDEYSDDNDNEIIELDNNNYSNINGYNSHYNGIDQNEPYLHEETGMDDDENMFGENGQEQYTNEIAYHQNDDIEEIPFVTETPVIEKTSTTFKQPSATSRFQCQFCSYIGKNHAKLQLHLATHYNLKQYQCPICNQRANFKWDIQKHMRKIHNDHVSEVICLSEKDARQTISSYIESTKQSSAVDMTNQQQERFLAQKRTHTALRERKYKCSLCDRTSEWQWDIRKHLRTIHRDQPGADLIVITPEEQQENNLDYNSQMAKAPIISSLINATCSDQSGTKKFQCTQCPYRSNWKADLFRHLRKRHHVQQPQQSNIIVLSTDYAASSLEEYEQVHGINVRKRTRTDLESISNSYYENSLNQSDISNKKSKVDFGINDQDDKQENTRLPVSVAKLNIKPYKCLKCGFRSDRKSDTLRHIRIKHGVSNNTDRFLRTMSIQEASNTIENYENMRLYKKIKSFNSDSTPNIYEEAIQQFETEEQHHVEQLDEHVDEQLDEQLDELNDQYNQNQHADFIQINEISSKQEEVSSTQHKCGDYYRCPFCSFKNDKKMVMRRHLAIHFRVRTNQRIITVQPTYQPTTYQCHLCSFKSKWKFSVKKHIQMNHSIQENVLSISSDEKETNKCDDQKNETQQNQSQNSLSQIKLENRLVEINTNSLQQDTDRVPETITLKGFDGKDLQVTCMVSNSLNTTSNGVNKKKDYFCQTCPYKTNNIVGFKQHILQHTFREGYAKCRYCDYYVSLVRLLKQHEVIHPEFEQRLTCKELKQM